VSAPWGASAPVTVSTPVSVVGWPGLSVTVTTKAKAVHGAVARGVVVGTMQAGLGTASTVVPLETATQLGGPGAWWRLTR